jgi:hypothetical protein
MSFFLRGVTTKPAATVGVDLGAKTVQYMDKKIKFKK